MRITMDLDFPSQLKLLSTYFNLRQFGMVEVRVSASGMGYHMIVRGLNITYEDSLRIRAMLGECRTRLRFDSEENHKMKQILWDQKVVNERVYEARTITEADLLVLPSNSKPPMEVFKRRYSRQFSGRQSPKRPSL